MGHLPTNTSLDMPDDWDDGLVVDDGAVVIMIQYTAANFQLTFRKMSSGKANLAINLF